MRLYFFVLVILFFSPLGKDCCINTPSYLLFTYLYLVVRGKSFLVETEADEDEAMVSEYDGSNEDGFRPKKPKMQNRCLPFCGGGWW